MKNLKNHLLEASTRRGGVCLALIELRELESLAVAHGEFIIDEILVSQHRRLRRAVRPTDIIARMNDNTFGIIMHHTKVKDYKASAIERILTMINNRAYKTTAGNLSLSGCIGVHYYRGDEAIISPEVMIKAAENKLAEARNDMSLSIAY
jgi:diguanylate cyclase (GGDEF)-like protein